MNRSIVITATILLISGIVFGAFGAHSLKALLSPEKMSSFETGIKYQFYMGLGQLILGVNHDRFGISLKWVYRFNLIGVLFFSGSIYLLALEDVLSVNMSFLWPITPIGGLLLIIGWTLLLIGLLRKKA
ncbi:MAG: DUF423 domain-containing protein [Bacteroidota bacterium]|jgi:uncharacterized membrane protein YgdD (TMEM256/DUF423 family)